MKKVLIKSKYIHYGRQVQNTELEVSEPEVQMLKDIGVTFEIIEEPKEKEPAYKRKKKEDDADNV